MKSSLFHRESVRITGFLAVLVLLLAIASAMMDPEGWFDTGLLQNRNARAAEIREQPAYTIDIMNLGDSLSTSDFTPMELWKQRGYTSFNIGADGIRMTESRFALEDACRRQKPRYLLMETLQLLRYDEGMDRQMVLSQRLYHTFDFLKFHSIWKKLIEPPGDLIYHRGYVVNGRSRPYEGPADYLTDREIDDQYHEEVSDFNRTWFRKMKRFCDRNGIVLVLYSAPSPEIYNLPRIRAVQAFAQEEQVTYIDLNEYTEEMGLDWSTDTTDRGDHLNVCGAAKSTVFLLDKMEELRAGEDGPLTDHRGDSAYRDWEEELPAYEQLVRDMEGKSFSDVRREKRAKEE